MINEKPQVINEYESGKAIPNPQVGEDLVSELSCDAVYPMRLIITSFALQILSKLSRVLGVTLKKNPKK